MGRKKKEVLTKSSFFDSPKNKKRKALIDSLLAQGKTESYIRGVLAVADKTKDWKIKGKT